MLNVGRSGIPVSRWTFPIFMAAALFHTQVSLPPVDDPQACDLDRSVWQLGLCRMRPLYHLVSGWH